MLRAIQAVTFVFLLPFSPIFAFRFFNITISDFQCITSRLYMEKSLCNVDNSDPGVSLININAPLQKEIRDLRMNFSIDFIRNDGQDMPQFRSPTFNGCTMKSRKITSPLLKLLKKSILKVGEWPDKCPVPANFTLEADNFPVFVPDCGFNVVIMALDKNVEVFRTTTIGRITRNRKSGR